MLCACADATAPTSLDATGLPRARADMDVNQTVPVALAITNPCNGDALALTGTLHMLIHITQSTSGNQHFYGDYTGQYSGVAAPSLVNYNGYTRNFEDFSTMDPFPIVDQFITSLDLNSATGVDNFHVTIHLKVTVNANGETTVDYNEIDSSCNG